MNELFDLSGRTALVTGGRRGIGLGMAVALAQAGADIVVASAGQETDGTSSIEKLVREAGREFEAHQVDLSDRGAVTAFGEMMARRTVPVDVLVNNAGTIRRRAAVDHDDEAWDAVLATNLSAPFVLARALGAQMVERGYGKIIFTASLLSFQGGILVPGYTASKSGVLGLTRALSNEWGPHGVNVNAIVPGYIATDNTQALQDDSTRSRAILERIPAGRWGTPADLAGATVFLASRASDYVHGASIAVDGGWLAR